MKRGGTRRTRAVGGLGPATPGAPYEVVSALDEPAWQPGQVVPERTATRAPLLRASGYGARGSAS